MPHTLTQRIVAAVMLGASVVLGVLIFLTTRTEETLQPTPPVSATTAAGAGQTATPSRPEEAVPPVAVNGEKKAKAKLKATTSFRLSAARDTWLEVRAGSEDGEILYTGILKRRRSVTFYTGIPQQGRSVTSSGQRLWIRFASASNVAATVNGKPLPLPAGTYNALISPAGVKRVPG